MFSDESQKNLLKIIEDAIRDNFSVENLEFISCDSKAPENKNEITLLTISSYSFRLIIFLHFSLDPATREFIADQVSSKTDNNKLDSKKSSEHDQKLYLDYLSELSNGFCGQVKRILGKQFSHLGMSTPNPLSKHNFAYIDTLDCNVKNFRQIKINPNTNFYLSLCLCFQENKDFKIDAPEQDESMLGELEFF